jgi:hypothetical protein
MSKHFFNEDQSSEKEILSNCFREKVFTIQIISYMLYAINDWFCSIYHNNSTVRLTYTERAVYT